MLGGLGQALSDPYEMLARKRRQDVEDQLEQEHQLRMLALAASAESDQQPKEMRPGQQGAGLLASLLLNAAAPGEGSNFFQGLQQGFGQKANAEVADGARKKTQKAGLLGEKARYAGQKADLYSQDVNDAQRRSEKLETSKQNAAIKRQGQMESRWNQTAAKFAAASNGAEARYFGKQLQQMAAQNEAFVPPIAEEIEAAAQAADEQVRNTAFKQFQDVLKLELNNMGLVSDERRPQLEAYRQQLLTRHKDIGLELPELPTGETLAKKRMDQYIAQQADIKKFRWEVMARESRDRVASRAKSLEIARRRVEIAEQNQDLAESRNAARALKGVSESITNDTKTKDRLTKIEKVLIPVAKAALAKYPTDDKRRVPKEAELEALNAEWVALKALLRNGMDAKAQADDIVASVTQMFGGGESGTGTGGKPPDEGTKAAIDAIRRGADPAKVRARFRKLYGREPNF